ncbi:uncharacterized protein K452DRAFT_117076 [Aplosporella prunicola CBS 121167]|uniref:Uncharacterized protein n=1 Tax=Aplosporella prunicola CBS 121167 TaxID=1176127 RepID=A0A6A6AYA9_9PEZI|nr:uncharacterized protein K452DRAFT_117076 [Aplosporella prunicola CBS 121167]KAF2136922.1 hypothetical protein K452DRAFT_117076 [Aplosporella prunicola CBS 121167]
MGCGLAFRAFVDSLVGLGVWVGVVGSFSISISSSPESGIGEDSRILLRVGSEEFGSSWGFPRVLSPISGRVLLVVRALEKIENLERSLGRVFA